MIEKAVHSIKIRLLLVLEEVSKNLEDGKKFYDEREPAWIHKKLITRTY